jgi:hypothetical protein
MPTNSSPVQQPSLTERAQPQHDPHIASFRSPISLIQAVLERHSLASEQFVNAFIDLINVKKEIATSRIAGDETESSL